MRIELRDASPERRSSVPRGVPEERKREVVEWMRRTGNGTKAAAQHWGHQRNSIKVWARQYGLPNAPDRAPLSPLEQALDQDIDRDYYTASPATDAELPPWDPAQSSREDWLRQAVSFALRLAHAEKTKPSARHWYAFADARRKELEEVIAERKRAEAEVAKELPPLEELAGRLLDRLVQIAVVHPEAGKAACLRLADLFSDDDELQDRVKSLRKKLQILE